MLPGMPTVPGEDFINSFYPILIALVLGLILGFRFVFRKSPLFAGQCKHAWMAKLSDGIIPVSLNTASALSALWPLSALLSARCMGELQWLSAL